MVSLLYRFLREQKNYTEDEAEVVALSYECGFEIPSEEVKKDIKEWSKQWDIPKPEIDEKYRKQIMKEI